MDIFRRRALLETTPNPYQRLDYVSDLGGRIVPAGDGPPVMVAVRYVPDRLVVASLAFGRYLEALAAVEWASLETLAATILDDANNELVPRWVQVTAESRADASLGGISRAVMLEDRQPRWDNKALLGRLRRF